MNGYSELADGPTGRTLGCSPTVADTIELVHLMGQGNGIPAPLIYRKGWALLGYLAVESGRMHSRAALAELFWPDLSESSALTNLRQVLSNLNRYCAAALGEGVLQIERTAVCLRRSDAKPILFDIDLLQQAPCQAVSMLSEQRIFLEGMEDIAEIDFQSWLQGARQMFEGQLISAAEKCCDEMLENDQWDRSIELARELSKRDPWSDKHARRLMHAHAGGGMRAAAVKTYQRFETLLREELGLSPGQETRYLFEQLAGRGQREIARVAMVAV